jgi:hypothetical protein
MEFRRNKISSGAPILPPIINYFSGKKLSKVLASLKEAEERADNQFYFQKMLRKIREC